MKKENKFRVIPNLSLKGPEILRRINNRSLILEANKGQYSLDKEIDESRRMSKLDKINRHRELINDIKTFRTKLENGQ